jgi:hypothetical protein
MRPPPNLLTLASLLAASSLLAADALDGIPVTVLSRSTVTEGERTITYVRIRPPALPPRPVPAPVPSAAPSAADLAEWARLEAKPRITLAVSATVHLRPPVVTELRWRSGGREWVAWSNVDFRLLSQLTDWETETAVYNWFPFLFEIGPNHEQRPADLGLAPASEQTPAEYVVEGTAAEVAAAEADLAPLDYLHAYHDVNRAELIAAQAAREAAAAEAARQAALAPTKPKDQTIYFWKIETPAATP